MAISKDKKAAIAATFGAMLKDATSVAFVQFKGLSVKEASALRRGLREEGVSYKVGKKTLLKRALSGMSVMGELPALEGEIAVATSSTDALAPARAIYNFQKTHEGMLTLVGGIFEGAYKDQASMTTIATIPSREVLLAQIAFLLKSPLQRLAIAVNEVSKTK